MEAGYLPVFYFTLPVSWASPGIREQPAKHTAVKDKQNLTQVMASSVMELFFD